MGSPYSPTVDYAQPSLFRYPQSYDDLPPAVQHRPPPPPPMGPHGMLATPPPPPGMPPIDAPLQPLPPGYGGPPPPHGPFGDPFMPPFHPTYHGIPPGPPLGPFGAPHHHPPHLHPPMPGMFGSDCPPELMPHSGAFLNRYADMAVHDIIPPSELATIVPTTDDTNVDRDISMMLNKAHKYGGAIPGGHNSRRKYAKYVFLAGYLLAKRGLPSVAVPEDPDDPWVKLLQLYMCDTSRLGMDPEQVLVVTLQKQNKGRHHHHHHHHHHRHRSASRSRTDRSRSRGNRSRSRSRSRRSKTGSCTSSTEWES